MQLAIATVIALLPIINPFSTAPHVSRYYRRRH